MTSIGLVVEGLIDRFAAERVLVERGLSVDPSRIIVTGGKQRFDARLAKYNEAARLAPWLALRGCGSRRRRLSGRSPS